jgi:hypothetical protein
MMKRILHSFFLFLFFNAAQSQVLSGIYRGVMEVDTPKNTINFELSLKQKKDKITGYCYRLFVQGDTVFYNLVKVSARIKDSLLLVEDERSVSNNFEVSTKGIKTRFFFKLKDIQDTANLLTGEWQTTFWKRYMPLQGKITVNRDREYKNSQIYSRLNDLNLLQEMELEEQDSLATINQENIAKVKQQTISDSAITKKESRKLNKQKSTAPETIAINTNKSVSVPEKTVITPVIKPAEIALKERKSEPVQQKSLEVYSDSITLSIYDNGEIDGDTVSVFVNNVQLVSKVGLSAQAYKITIPVQKNQINKVELFAENLGRIPPNTGLLVIYSGEQRYQIFFTATLEKNAIIYLERKE